MERKEVDDCLKDCQALLSLSPKCHGWLRIPTKVHAIGEVIGQNITKIASFTNKLANKFCWDRHYVILHARFIFIFKEETSRRPEKIIRLSEFKNTSQVESEGKSIPWPFKLSKKCGEQFQLFAATSKEDRSKWMKAFQNDLKKQNTQNDVDGNEYNNIDDDNDPSGDDNDDDGDDNDDGGSDDDDLEYEDPATVSKRKHLPLPPLPNGIPNRTSHASDAESARPLRLTSTISKSLSLSETKDRKRSQIDENKSLDGRSQRKAPPRVPAKPSPISGKLTNLSLSSNSSTMSVPMQNITEDVYELDNAYEDVTSHVGKSLSELSMWTGGVEEASEIMAKLSKVNGTFLVRKTTDSPGYTLAVIDELRTKKFKITVQDHVYSLSSRDFSELEALLVHFVEHNLPNKSFKLILPYSLALKQLS